MTFKTWKKWTKEEDESLKSHWADSSMEVLMDAFHGRSYASLMCRARTLGVKSLIDRSRKNGNISSLLDKTSFSFYALGFILADGCFSRKNDLILNQSPKESKFFYEFVEKLTGSTSKIKTRNYISGFSGELSQILSYRIGQKAITEKIRSLIDVGFNKTYEPPKNIAYFFDKELFPYFFIGLIDGDGCIWLTNKTSGPQIRIELHYNWLPILDQIKNFVLEAYGIELRTRVSNRGFAQLIFGNVRSIKWLYYFAKDHFKMESKWNKLDLYVRNNP